MRGVDCDANYIRAHIYSQLVLLSNKSRGSMQNLDVKVDKQMDKQTNEQKIGHCAKTIYP